MEQESTLCKYPPAPFQMDNFPPLKLLQAVGRAWPAEANVSRVHNAQQ